MKIRFFLIALLGGAIVSFIPDRVAAQTPTPAPKSRQQRPGPSPTVSYKPAATPAPNKPPTSASGPSTNTNLAKLPIVSATNAVTSSNLPKAATKPKPLSPAEKQQVLSGQTAANPLVLDTMHLAADGAGVSAELVFSKSGVWIANAFISSGSENGGLIVSLKSKSSGQMYLVDIAVDGVTGFKLNGEPFPAGIVGGSNHLLFFVRGDSGGSVSSKITADHEWQFYSCEISAVK